jgi:hypothetical protein
LGAGQLGPEVLKEAIARAERLATELQSGSGPVQCEIVPELVEKATIGAASVRIELKREALAACLLGEAFQELDLDGTILLSAPLHVTRRGMETRLVIEADGAARALDPALIKAVWPAAYLVRRTRHGARRQSIPDTSETSASSVARSPTLG